MSWNSIALLGTGEASIGIYLHMAHSFMERWPDGKLREEQCCKKSIEKDGIWSPYAKNDHESNPQRCRKAKTNTFNLYLERQKKGKAYGDGALALPLWMISKQIRETVGDRSMTRETSQLFQIMTSSSTTYRSAAESEYKFNLSNVDEKSFYYLLSKLKNFEITSLHFVYHWTESCSSESFTFPWKGDYCFNSSSGCCLFTGIYLPFSYSSASIQNLLFFSYLFLLFILEELKVMMTMQCEINPTIISHASNQVFLVSLKSAIIHVFKTGLYFFVSIGELPCFHFFTCQAGYTVQGTPLIHWYQETPWREENVFEDFYPSPFALISLY